MNIDWKPLCDIIESNHRFVISSHVRPDADAVGSALALANMLKAKGKTAQIVNPSGLPNSLKFLDPHANIYKIGAGLSVNEACETDVHIILDTSAWAQLLDVGKVFKRTKAIKVVIDHHASSDSLGAIEFKDTTREATGSMIYDLAQALGAPITPESATALYCAIATDTGWFRFPSTNSQTMRIVGDLIDLGAQPHLIYKQLYEQFTVSRIRLAGRILSRIESDCGGRLAYICVKQQDFSETGASQADTEDLVNECLKIAGTECVFIAIEQLNKTVKVSFRSRTDLNVAKIAEKFGGGGHKQAAGAVLPGPLADILARLLTTLKSALGPCEDAVAS